MRAWFIPCFSGDFRLEPEGETSVLTVENPTALDRQRLDPFLVAAKARGWLDPAATYSHVGLTRLPIAAAMVLAGPVLAELAVPEEAGRERWTALRHATGIVLTDDLAQAQVLIAGGSVRVSNDQVEIVAAATLRAPARGCPPPAPALTRAAEALGAFSTARQLRSYLGEGRMVAFGNATGHPYAIFHRGEAARRGLGHCVVNLSSHQEICAWDDSVPAEEETLALKLAVEHRERWLLSNPGRLPARRRSRPAAT